MTPAEFVAVYYPLANEVCARYGVPVEVCLAQAALESGWAKAVPKFNFFGYKAGSTWTGAKQLLWTWEVFDTRQQFINLFGTNAVEDGLPRLKLSTLQQLSSGKWTAQVRDYFRAYSSAEGSFEDYCKLVSGGYYSRCHKKTTDPFLFAKGVAQCGYATDPNYYNKLATIIMQIQGLLPTVKTLMVAIPLLLLSSSLMLIASATT